MPMLRNLNIQTLSASSSNHSTMAPHAMTLTPGGGPTANIMDVNAGDSRSGSCMTMDNHLSTAFDSQDGLMPVWPMFFHRLERILHLRYLKGTVQRIPRYFNISNCVRTDRRADAGNPGGTTTSSPGLTIIISEQEVEAPPMYDQVELKSQLNHARAIPCPISRTPGQVDTPTSDLTVSLSTT